MSLRRLSLFGCVLMCLAGPAKAHQAQLTVEQGLDVDSNVLGNQNFPVRDGVYRMMPTIALDQPDDDWTYALRYRPVYSGYFDTDGINGWDHALTARSNYKVTGRDALEFSANFASVRGIRTNSFLDAAGQTQVLPTQPGRTQTFNTDLAYSHGFSARTTGRFNARYDRWDYTIPGRVGNHGLGGGLQVYHSPIERLSVGLGVDARYRAFEASIASPAAFTTVLNSNLLARYQVTRHLHLDLSGGPAGVFSEQSEPGPTQVSRWSPVLFDPVSCPMGFCARVWGSVPPPAATTNCGTLLGTPVLNRCGLTPFAVTTVPGFPEELVVVPVDPNQQYFGRSTRNLTYFVSITAAQQLRKGLITASFVRNEDGGSGVGASSIVNFASLSVSYSLTDVWTLNLTGSYFLRETISRFPTIEITARPSSVTVGGLTLAEAGYVIANPLARNFEQRVGSTDLSLLRQLGERSRLRFHFRYYNQSQDTLDGSPGTGFDKFVVGVSYVYQFDAYKF